MHIVLKLRQLLAGEAATPPVGPPIQARERAAAQERVLAQARQRQTAHLRDGLTR
ncbi:hypothetical protein [Micromonospora sp. NPDC048898]|uniref:hypothetical protein n=1 Tax=Micromonospora sp. NPDC048898 TaxID=3364260 RepID=UPI0037211E94